MSNDRPQDDRVSTTYRSLANERTPQHLDDKILQMAAAKAQQPRYSRWMAWSRPLAWAATITLCLAITLELTREPSLEPGRTMPAEIAQSPVAGQARRTAPEPPAAAEAESTSVAVLEQKDERLTATYDAPDDDYAPAAPRPDELRERETADALAKSMASEKTALARSAAMQPTANLIQEEEQEPPARESAETADLDTRYEMAAVAMMSADAEADQAVLEEIVVVDDCDDAVRSDPKTWLECILELEEAGDDEAAERQREALVEVFPDFKMP